MEQLLAACKSILPHLTSDLDCHDSWAKEIAAFEAAVAEAEKHKPGLVLVTVIGGVAEDVVGGAIILDWDNVGGGDKLPADLVARWGDLPKPVREEIGAEMIRLERGHEIPGAI